MEPYYADEQVTLYVGDCLKVLAGLPDASVDAVVTDPPAGVHFMGRDWDSDRGGRDRWIEWLGDRMCEAYRVLKPGGHALVWALPRTSHWTAMALEDAGFQIRDCVLHLFGGGFPKSLDVGKAIDKAAGAEREVVGRYVPPNGKTWNLSEDQARSTVGAVGHNSRSASLDRTAPATDDARHWEGWGTALKPGQEIWWLVRKPLQGTVAANVLEYGTGALNIGACRVEASGRPARQATFNGYESDTYGTGRSVGLATGTTDTGRWPSNVVFTHPPLVDDAGEVIGDACSDGCVPGCPVAELDAQSGVRPDNSRQSAGQPSDGFHGGIHNGASRHRKDTAGGASRYFPVFRYEAKAPASERPRLADGTAWPTVKPLGLMRWLIRLITPPDGLVLDCFAGSGATAEAAVIEGFRCLLIERDPDAAELIRTRLSKPIQPTLGDIA
jgi:hypothetical protein